MTYCQPPCAMSIGPPILRYSYFKIWPRRSIVKVMCVVKVQGHVWPSKFKGQGYGQGQTHWSHLSSIDMFAFRFVAIGPLLAEIYQVPYLTLKNLGQGHDENRPKSNLVIYRSGTTIVPKWKKSEKLFKSYRVNKNLRPAAPATACEPVQKHKVTPGIPGWLHYYSIITLAKFYTYWTPYCTRQVFKIWILHGVFHLGREVMWLWISRRRLLKRKNIRAAWFDADLLESPGP